jgi:hypothetical protein
MLDGLLRPVVDPPLDRTAEWLAALGVSADTLTWTGFAIGFAALPAIAAEHYVAALILRETSEATAKPRRSIS